MRSKTIDASSAAKGRESSRASMAGRMTSPARAGRTVLAANPIEVARNDGHQGTRPTGRRIQTQRRALKAKVEIEIAAHAAIPEKWTRERKNANKPTARTAEAAA